MSDKKQRANFSQIHWNTLQDIIIHGEGGRFLNALRVRNAATNMTKAEIWETITQMFIQVRFSTAFVCQFWFVSQEIRITAVDIFMYINMNTDMSRART
jgi:hypothetical protein